MTLESTMICMDSSDYMRNGDFQPNRFLVQQDGIQVVCRSKTRANPENNVGLLTLSNMQVLVQLTTDVRKIYLKMAQVKPNGKIQLEKGIRLAQLALKHRQGRSHKMRIVAFIGSPITSQLDELLQIAKKLKKEKVNVDIVNFGENDNIELLESFIQTLNGKEGSGSHLITIPAGCELATILMTSSVIVGSNPAAIDLEFGIDGSEDPELLLALRLSMEEEQQRQAEVNNTTQTKDTLLPNTIADNVDVMSEEEQIALAMRMSMQHEETKSTEDSEEQEIIDEYKQYLQSMMEHLPGLDYETVRDPSESSNEQNKKEKNQDK